MCERFCSLENGVALGDAVSSTLLLGGINSIQDKPGARLALNSFSHPRCSNEEQAPEKRKKKNKVETKLTFQCCMSVIYTIFFSS